MQYFGALDSTITTSPTVNTTSATVIAANGARRSFILYNNSAGSVYITFGATSTVANPSIIIPGFSSWAWPTSEMCYTGVISAIYKSGNGTITVTEFTLNSWI